MQDVDNVSEQRQRQQKVGSEFPELQILNSSPNRLPNVISEVQKLHPLNFRIYKFDQDPTNKVRGCYEAHIEIWKRCESENTADFVFVCEDSIFVHPNLPNQQFPSDFSDRFRSFIRDERFQNSWNLIYVSGFFLPHWTSPIAIPGHSGFFETKATHGASGYIVHKRMMHQVLEYHSDFKGQPWDAMLESFPNRYILRPLLFRRNPNVNSIVNAKQEKNWRKFAFGTGTQDIFESMFFRGMLNFKFAFRTLKIAILLVLIVCISISFYIANRRSRKNRKTTQF
jgi:hypothetical protein